MSRGIARLAGTLIGVAVSFLVGVVRYAQTRLETRKTARAAVIPVIAAVSLLAAFSTYSLMFCWKETRSVCGDAKYAELRTARWEALREGESRLRSPFSLLPELIGFRASHDCAEARAELEVLDRGECPRHLLPGMPCVCGASRWPDDAKCARPSCERYPTLHLQCYDR